ncbi:MAG TPA: hypothetical protein VF627_10150, partial [Abditibacterium sp.]
MGAETSVPEQIGESNLDHNTAARRFLMFFTVPKESNVIFELIRASNPPKKTMTVITCVNNKNGNTLKVMSQP